MQGIKSSYADPQVDRAAFVAWHQEGTIYKACIKLQNDGVVSSRGKPFTPDGVRKAAVRYMITHYAEAKSSFKIAYERFGYTVNDEFIERLLIKMAVSTLKRPAKVKHWMIENGLYDQHKIYVESLVTL